MSLRTLARRRARNSSPPMTLPAPGSLPAPKPSWQVIVIFVIIQIVIGWLLTWGYSIETAFEVVGGASVLASAIAARLATAQPVAG